MEKIKTKEYAEVQVLLVVLKIKDKIKLERLNLTISFSKMAYNVSQLHDRLGQKTPRLSID